MRVHPRSSRRRGDRPRRRLTKFLRQIKAADDHRRGELLTQLAAMTPIEARRGEVSRLLEAKIRRDDIFGQGPVLRALATWGDAQGRERLAKAVEDRAYPKWDEAMAALATTEPTDRAIRAIAGRLKDDPNRVGETLRRFGPRVEPVLRVIAREASDPASRAGACTLPCSRVRFAPDSVETLEELAKLAGIEPIAASAGAAASAIDEAAPSRSATNGELFPPTRRFRGPSRPPLVISPG